ncbi:MAG: hypothetical protein RRA63_04795 [Candidatus Calescibacterium sp.]|jgi:hypothetical protein|nr:hypothetical protein [Candidatus Calescibacterium sp.]
MDTKKISGIVESIKSVSERVKEVPKENFNIIFEEEIRDIEKKLKTEAKNENSKISNIKSFIQGIAMRNIIFENEKAEEK